MPQSNYHCGGFRAPKSDVLDRKSLIMQGTEVSPPSSFMFMVTCQALNTAQPSHFVISEEFGTCRCLQRKGGLDFQDSVDHLQAGVFSYT
jgi:hypothetical protein